MSIDAEAIFKAMLGAATNAFGDQWDHVKNYVPGEFKKLAVQIADVAENVAKYEADPTQGYPADTGKVLVRMQRNALEAVLTAVTALTLLAVQNAMDGVVAVLKKAFGGVVAVLLA